MDEIILQSETGTEIIIDNPASTAAEIIVDVTLQGPPGPPGADGAGSGSASQSSRTIFQTAHGFSAGQPLYLNGSAYALASARAVDTAEVVGIVAAVGDVNSFTLSTEGYIEDLSGFVAGQGYFLGTTPGTLSLNEPVIAGQVSRLLFVADSATSGYFHKYLGSVVGSATVAPPSTTTTTTTIGGTTTTTTSGGTTTTTTTTTQIPDINYVPNPTFELGYYWWTPYGAYDTIVRDAAAQVAGTYSSRHTNTTPKAGGIKSDTFTLPVGTYTISVYAKVGAGVTNAGLVLRRFLDQSLVINDVVAYSDGQWQRLLGTFTVTDATVQYQALLQQGAGSSTSQGTVYFDAVQIEPLPSATAYFDGSVAGCSWSGTADQSPSFRGAASFPSGYSYPSTGSSPPSTGGTDTTGITGSTGEVTAGALGGSYTFDTPIATSAPTFPTVTGPVAKSTRLSSLTGPIPTNAWWTNLHMGENPIACFPYLVKPTSTGMDFCYPLKTQYQTTSLFQTFVPAMSLNAVETLTARTITAFDDLTVTVKWPTSGAGYLQACFAEGMGFVSMRYSGLTPSIAHPGAALLSVNGAAPGSNVTGTKFKLTFNSGQTWIVYASSSITLSTDVSAAMVATSTFTGHIRVVLLGPGNSETALDTSSTASVTAGVVAISVASNVATTTFTWSISGSGSLLMHALPHHMDVLSGATPAGVVLNSMKGDTVGIVGNSWTLIQVLPTFRFTSPHAIDSSKTSAIASALTADAGGAYGSGLTDPYFGSKYLARWARLAQIADELGDTANASLARAKMKPDIVAWLDATNADRLLYDTRWGGIISTNGAADIHADFGNGIYNDHHFHYGYMIYAAAVLAKGDAGFVTSYADKVNELVREIANPSASDTYFSKYRLKDWYHGHSWAQGLDNTGDPKDSESTSEGVNAYYAVMLWGLASANDYVAAIGQVMMATEITSAKKYWHLTTASTIYNTTMNNNKVVGIVWGTKIDYATFFGANDEYIHGIQMLPFTPATELYLTSDWISESWPVIQSRVFGRTAPYAADVVNGGSGYLAAPISTFVGPDGGTSYGENGFIASGGTGMGLQFNANAHAAGGGLYELFVVFGQAGSGYTEGDIVTLSGHGGSGAQARLHILPEQGWQGFLYGAHAVIDKATAWGEISALTDWDGGNSRTNMLHWVATRP